MASASSMNKNNSGRYTLLLLSWYLNSCPAVKRIMQEARELANDPSTDYVAAPLEVLRFTINNLLLTLTLALGRHLWMALYNPWNSRYRIRRRTLPLAHLITCGVSLSPPFANGAHS